MNRLVLIGNGFDIAHGLDTGYQSFIFWYWTQRVEELMALDTKVSDDGLSQFNVLTTQYESWKDFAQKHANQSSIELFEKIIKEQDMFLVHPCDIMGNVLKSMRSRNWVDIEYEFYSLVLKCMNPIGHGGIMNKKYSISRTNEELRHLQEKLIEYLQVITQKKIEKYRDVEKQIYDSLMLRDIAGAGKPAFEAHLQWWLKAEEDIWSDRFRNFEIYCDDIDRMAQWLVSKLSNFKDKDINTLDFDNRDIQCCLLPDNILLLNFNYTDTVQMYLKGKDVSSSISIHGDLDHQESIIFGYGDELDIDYKKIQNLNDNTYLTNIKSIRYLESDNYRRVNQFLESAPFQVYIMGHSCGISDRTLLNKIFEHNNCVSIKPYFYKYKDEGGAEKDNYNDIVQNISRNFTDMNKMRDRVVNKKYCEQLGKYKSYGSKIK